MFENGDQFEGVIAPDGPTVLPAALMERQGWKPETPLLIEKTDDAILITAGPAKPRAPAEIASVEVKGKRLTYQTARNAVAA